MQVWMCNSGGTGGLVSPMWSFHRITEIFSSLSSYYFVPVITFITLPCRSQVQLGALVCEVIITKRDCESMMISIEKYQKGVAVGTYVV